MPGLLAYVDHHATVAVYMKFVKYKFCLPIVIAIVASRGEKILQILILIPLCVIFFGGLRSC